MDTQVIGGLTCLKKFDMWDYEALGMDIHGYGHTWAWGPMGTGTYAWALRGLRRLGWREISIHVHQYRGGVGTGPT
jgi:hypothetical protein